MRVLLFALVAQAADLASTIFGFQHGNIELNPVVGQSPFLAIDIKIIACLTIALVYLVTRHSEISKVVSYALIVGSIFTIAISTWNIGLTL